MPKGRYNRPGQKCSCHSRTFVSFIGFHFAEGEYPMLEWFVDHWKIDGKLVYTCGEIFYFHRRHTLFDSFVSGHEQLCQVFQTVKGFDLFDQSDNVLGFTSRPPSEIGTAVKFFTNTVPGKGIYRGSFAEV